MMGSISSTRAKGPCFNSPAKIPMKVKFKAIFSGVNNNDGIHKT